MSIDRTHINIGILNLRFCVYYSKYTYWDLQNILSSNYPASYPAIIHQLSIIQQLSISYPARIGDYC
jgi:hypothetical protein